MTTQPVTWEGLQGSLPGHEDELRCAHEGRPTMTEQDATHGAGLPAEDRGTDDREKLR